MRKLESNIAKTSSRNPTNGNQLTTKMFISDKSH